MSKEDKNTNFVEQQKTRLAALNQYLFACDQSNMDGADMTAEFEVIKAQWQRFQGVGRAYSEMA